MGKSIFRNIFWLSFDKIFRLLLSLFVGAAVAHYLGPQLWGKINYVLAYISILVTIVALGIDGFLIKGILEEPERKNDLLGTAFAIRCIIVLLSFFSVCFIFYILHYNAEYFIIFFCLFFNVIAAPFDLIDIDYQAMLQSKKSVQAKSTAYIIGAIVKITAILFKAPVTVFALILGLETLLASVLLLKKYQVQNNIKMWRYKKKLVAYILKNAWPYFLSAISVILYMRLDQIMLGNLLSVNKVGEFSAAVRISEIFLFIPIAISGSYYASLINAKKAFEDYKQKVQLLLNLMFIISLVLAIGVTIFSNLIVNILYGQQFIEASTILKIHVWSLIAIFLGVVGNQYLVIEDLQRISLYNTVLGLITNIIMNFIFIPKWGAIGAAYATLITQTLSSIISNFFYKQSRELFVYQLRSFLSVFKIPSIWSGLKEIK